MSDVTITRIFAAICCVFVLLTAIWQDRKITQLRQAVHHLRQVVHDQQVYIDAGCHGRYEGEEVQP